MLSPSSDINNTKAVEPQYVDSPTFSLNPSVHEINYIGFLVTGSIVIIVFYKSILMTILFIER